MPILELVVGLVLLLAGGDALVRGAVALATRLSVPPLVIGLTLVGFGTSTPELVASLAAALRDAPGVAVGNIVGSNIANILLILGVGALILPLAVPRGTLRRDGAVLIGATLVMTAIVLTGSLARWAGAVLVLSLAAYTAFAFRSGLREGASGDEVVTWPRSAGTGLALAVGGIAGVVVGADLLVDAAIQFAAIAGVSEAVIGLTVVAVGTSLPELATAVVAALRRQADVALGNVIGSNIFNILGIAGVTALVVPIDVPPEIARFDVWVMLVAALALVALAAASRGIGRLVGAALLTAYVVYIAVLVGPALSAGG
ncbi:calcium/sodium antiporter [Acuticoccus sp.]|uniref:calcium/sodium antiporter n=1 Tax=Acuticoccus sp. TaxID=1904378 RepID=UPI003B52AD48